MVIQFQVSEQTLTRLSYNRIAAESRNYLRAGFSFSSPEWEGIIKTALFRRGQDVYPVLLEEDGTCAVPDAVIKAGEFFVSLAGGDLIPTNEARVSVLESGILAGVFPPYVPEDWYNQLIGQFSDRLEEAKMQARQAMQSAGDSAASEMAVRQTAADFERCAHNMKEEVKNTGETEKKGILALSQEKLAAMERVEANVGQMQADVTQKRDGVTEEAQKVYTASEAAQLAQAAAQQAMTDLLSMLGEDVATLVGGKIPVEQIPPIALTKTVTAASVEEMQDLTEVEDGDFCRIFADGLIQDTYCRTDGQWLKIGQGKCAEADHALQADTAVNAGMVNNHRIVTMTRGEYETAVKDENTLYLVGDFS